nr:ribose-5-phosphate isomerase RpiA [Tepidiphilus sp. J10]
MPMTHADELKRLAGEAAVAEVPEGIFLGVGTGSTVNCFIDALVRSGKRIRGAVSSSEATTERLRRYGIPVLDATELDTVPLYVDGADEIDPAFAMIKGGGGALTREKIVAAMAERFVCICDERKLVERLGRFPLPIEVIPMAERLVARRLRELGGEPRRRVGFVTDNGNAILDVHGLVIDDPDALETALNDIPGVVTNGIFAHRRADVLLLATGEGVQRRERANVTKR